MQQYVRRPTKYERSAALDLASGHVYLPEVGFDPDDADAPWRVVATTWLNLGDAFVNVLHVDDPQDGDPAIFRMGAGVWIADYSKDR